MELAARFKVQRAWRGGSISATCSGRIIPPASTVCAGRDGVIFRVEYSGGSDTLRFVSPSQDRSSWGQGHTAMKREQSAGETCSGSPAWSERQHRATRLKTTSNHAFAVEHTRTRPNLSRLDQSRLWPNSC